VDRLRPLEALELLRLLLLLFDDFRLFCWLAARGLRSRLADPLLLLLELELLERLRRPERLSLCLLFRYFLRSGLFELDRLRRRGGLPLESLLRRFREFFRPLELRRRLLEPFRFLSVLLDLDRLRRRLRRLSGDPLELRSGIGV